MNLLQQRLRQYESEGVRFLSSEAAATRLRQDYPEYARKKQAPFLKYVSRLKVKQNVETAGESSNEENQEEKKHKRPRPNESVVTNANLLNLNLRADYKQGGTTIRPIDDAAVSTAGEKGANSSNRAADSTCGVTNAKPVPGTVVTPENVRFDNFGAMSQALEPIYKCIYRLRNPESFPRQKTVTGILLHGPPGCGKTLLAHAIANEAEAPILKVAAAELSPPSVRALFADAERLARCIVLLDEIDSIAVSRKVALKEADTRTLTQLMTCMDSLSHLWDSSRECPGHVIIVGTTNRPEVIDPALRRCGRFSIEVALEVPDEMARAEILTVLTRDMPIDGPRDFTEVARKTRGFVAADLYELTQQACFVAERRRISASIDSEAVWWKHLNTIKGEPTVTMEDFETAASSVQASLAREGFSPSPKVSWDDIGGYSQVISDMKRSVSRCMTPSDECKKFGVRTTAGFLLHGPPGCGKTLIAKALASFANASFISVKGPELVRKYLGDSEAQIRSVFKRARECPPCIICFDEIDSLCLSRGREGNSAMDRVVNQFLVEMDAIPPGVVVIATTNKIDLIDEAFLRPGRLGSHIEIPLPDEEARVSILKAVTRNKPLAVDVDLVSLATARDLFGLSGSHLSELVEQACTAAVDEGASELQQRHLQVGLAKMIAREGRRKKSRRHSSSDVHLPVLNACISEP